MAARSLNKVMLIGNLTRDPELRYTPQGTPVCSFGIATNREWSDQAGQKQEETEFHNIVAWSKLGEICSQLLYKGRKVFVEGRMTTKTWQGQDGVERRSTEIVIEEMIAFGPGKPGQTEEFSQDFNTATEDVSPTEVVEEESVTQASDDDVKESKDNKDLAEEVADDIPF
jgi:single-strand DNA-binding protein